MRLLGVLFAWIVAVFVAYLAAVIASSSMVLADLVSIGRGVSVGAWLRTVVHDLGAMSLYLAVIAGGFAIAFFVADLVKSALPALAGIAYPMAGAVAIATALGVMEAKYGILPILGAQSGPGLWLQIGAGVLGGIAFELLRPKARDEV